ncbi:MAG: bifunctional phosphoribosylaminoimidazolecarboxamide formyltransferase/IMP cyclohydrolase [Anaerolineales bacterium]|nr:bifunctional phosphoribosylaminoimidazolecarboxamide formyltransferase/IMP cyclohydrolase [Anaerolineales bacterium]
MPTALISVSNKTGLVEKLAKPLHEMGWKLLASGGTAKNIRDAGLPVEDVAAYTGSPEILNGRVKTLHPAVHGGLLAQDTSQDNFDLKRINAEMIALAVVNLYPFQETIAQPDVTLEGAIEHIDIGGVALIRAAAKNFQRVTLICDPNDYEVVVAALKANGKTSLELRRQLAAKGFTHTMRYDAAISSYLAGEENKHLTLYPIQTLRYGENPHQKAIIYSTTLHSGPMGGQLLQGKPLSYNNLLDLDAAWRAAVSYQRPTVCIVKHLSPCGIASGDSLSDAYPLALASDPVSAFGGVIATNQEFDAGIASQIGKLFVECIAAPGFTSEALEILGKKKNLRLLEMPNNQPNSTPELRSITQGYLQQDTDLGDPEGTEWTVVTQRQPTEEEIKALEFAWVACQHVKSNAIVFVKGAATIGIGGGQPNRIDCVGIAAQRAGENTLGAVMASDAFFPFPDVVEAAAQHGITAIVQPGGSVKDQDSIDAANKHGIAMIFTGYRHFRH